MVRVLRYVWKLWKASEKKKHLEKYKIMFILVFDC